MEEELAQLVADCFPSMCLPLFHPLSFPSPPHGIPPQPQAVVQSCGHVLWSQHSAVFHLKELLPGIQVYVHSFWFFFCTVLSFHMSSANSLSWIVSFLQATDVVFGSSGSLMRPRRDPECH